VTAIVIARGERVKRFAKSRPRITIRAMTYDLLARYYDLENADFTEDLEFWLDLAGEYGDPILELGCGTGRVLLNLARRGHTVTGVDNSPEMLARLEAKLRVSSKQHIPAPPTLLRADMSDFTVEQKHALALMPFNTFMHLLTPEAQVATLQNVHRQLKAGGALVLDMPNPGEAYAAQEQGLTLERTFADGENTVQQFSSVTLDRAAQLARILWLYDSIAPDGTPKRTTVPLTLRYTFPGEMNLLLEKCGFTLAHLYGDYDHSPLADGLPRMIVVAEAV
jgi:SAM-dependent methyltransferase